MPRRARALLAATLVGASALGAAGCGVGAGAPAGDTQLRITRDFGTQTRKEPASPKTGGSDTQMRLLQRNANVDTRYGGGFVQTIDGLSAGRKDGRQVDWFYFVNGVQAEKGAASVDVHRGDRVWWDFHDWGATSNVPAVVGSFPEPFVHGIGGRRLPTREECVVPSSDPCRTVADNLAKAGIVAGRGRLLGSQGVKETLRVLVGQWGALREDAVLRPLEEGPGASGVYARMAADGKSIAVLDGRGRVTRRLGPGSGLIAATRYHSSQPIWVVTGTDDAGIEAAAKALDEGALAGKFALAVADGVGVRLPEVPK